MRSLPVFLDLSEGQIVVVGATAAARSKLRILRARGADIRWYPATIARDEAEAFFPDRTDNLFEIVHGEPGDAELAGAVAAIMATGAELDERLALRARRVRTPVNVVDRPDLSSFLFPALVDRGDVIVAIGTGGTAPVLARRLRAQIESLLPARLGELAAFLGRRRAALKERSGHVAADRRYWEQIIDGPVAAHVLEGRAREAGQLLDAMEKSDAGTKHPGTVALVGAGPGDPDLLTLKALRALQDADIIFYDALVTPGILARARRDATKILVGKRQGKPGDDQDDVNRRLILAASTGARVVRLKGGDPFVFGRGGEEMAALQAAGIPVSIVPGITAALGCSAEAEIPLTFRDEATKLVVLTGHFAKTESAIDWSGLADPATTIVVYMGLLTAAAIRDGLIVAGRSPETPAAVLARGTRADSFAVAGPLKDLAVLAAQAGEGPALLVVGDVVARSKPWRSFLLDAADRMREAA